MDNRQICRNCSLWGNGDGTGFPYDAGHVNICRHPQIDGDQHPSYGSCGEPVTMVYSGEIKAQTIQTRWNFGCVLFVSRVK